MKSIYVTSVERYSGKTAVCLALGKNLQAKGLKVAYLKPLSLQPWRTAGRIADEDAAFVKGMLGLEADP
ncbi:MAG: AAA family ATPase, partial [Anaerolineales bacterium]